MLTMIHSFMVVIVDRRSAGGIRVLPGSPPQNKEMSVQL
jgi:hypothetical protein